MGGEWQVGGGWAVGGSWWCMCGDGTVIEIQCILLPSYLSLIYWTFTPRISFKLIEVLCAFISNKCGLYSIYSWRLYMSALKVFFIMACPCAVNRFWWLQISCLKGKCAIHSLIFMSYLNFSSNEMVALFSRYDITMLHEQDLWCHNGTRTNETTTASKVAGLVSLS